MGLNADHTMRGTGEMVNIYDPHTNTWRTREKWYHAPLTAQDRARRKACQQMFDEKRKARERARREHFLKQAQA